MKISLGILYIELIENLFLLLVYSAYFLITKKHLTIKNKSKILFFSTLLY